MSDFFADIEQFHAQFGLLYEGSPRCLPRELSTFRKNFLREELLEYTKASAQADYLKVQARQQVLFPETPWDERSTKNFQDSMSEHLENMLDGLVDLVYVALGTAQLHGFNFKEAWSRVHEANMKKIRVTKSSDSKRNSVFDVVKPAGWVAPNHYDLVSTHEEKTFPEFSAKWSVREKGEKALIRLNPSLLGNVFKTSYGFAWDLVNIKEGSRLSSTRFFQTIEDAMADLDKEVKNESKG